jgi:general stress protein 26
MKEEFIKDGLELIKKADAAYLTTIDPDGFPSTRAMFNLRNSNNFPKLTDFMQQFDAGFTLFFTTNNSSIKVAHIINNPKVSVYFCDTVLFHGLMCQGEIEIIKDKSIKHAIWHDEWLMYYPDGKDSEDYAILKLQPKYVKRYFQLQQRDLRL